MGAFRLLSIVTASGMLAAILPACTSYTNVPGPDAATAQQDPNARQASRAAETALAWTVQRHPVEGPYWINLPPGTSIETAESIAATLGGMARVPDAPSTELPVYHVSRVWIRLSEGKVDVIFPARDGLNRQVQRAVTVWMNGGIRPWTARRGQYWSPGTVPVPEIWVPIPQAELDAIAEAERAAARAARQAQPVAAPISEPADEPVAEPAAPALETPPPSTPPEPVVSLEEPAAPASRAPASGGTTYREVPVGGGN